jgi:hypothetical protein
MRAALPVILVLLFILTCVGTCQTSKEATLQISAPCEAEKLKTSVTSASVIMVAQITDVRPSVGFWSGQFPVVQRVLYKVEEIIKGEVRESTINVGHYVIAMSPTADPEKPQLSPKLFRKGQSIILFLQTDPGKGYVDNQDINDREVKSFLSLDPCGLLSASEENIRIVKNFL